MGVRYYALIVGIAFLLVGLLGFIPGINNMNHPDLANHDVSVTSQYGLLLGIFPVNILHNIVHLLVGLLGVLAYRSYDGSRRYAIGLGIFYLLLAVMGILPAPFNTTFTLIPIFGNDVWLHALIAIIGLILAFTARPGYDDRVTTARRA